MGESPFVPLLALYLAAMLATGLLSRRRAGTAEGFFVAGRSLGPVLATCALSGTVVSGSAVLVAAELVYDRGLPGVWLDLVGAVALVVLGLALAARVRRSRRMTLAEFAGEAYGPRVRVVAALVTLVAQLFFLALLVRATATVVAPASGLDPALACVLAAATVTLYTLAGGQHAVARTDVAQLALMLVAVFGILVPCALSLPRGGAEPPEGMLSFPFNDRFTIVDFLAFALLYGLPHVVGSDVWSKLLSARDERTARFAAIASGVVKGAFGAGVAVVALAARSSPGIEAAGGSVLPDVLAAAVPEPWRSIASIGLVAVLMSSADTVLLTGTTVLANDVLPSRFGTVGAARGGAVVLASLGLILALAHESLLAPFRLGYTVYAAGLSLPVLAAFLPPGLRPGAGAVVAAMVLGGGVAVAGELRRSAPDDPFATLAGLAASAAALAIGILARRRPRPRPRRP